VSGPHGPNDEDDRRTLSNLLAAIALLVVAIAGIWLIRTLDARRKLEACAEAGRRDCLERLEPDLR
jgi:hypothetical protein